MSEQDDAGAAGRDAGTGTRVCPYCGHVAPHTKECEQCKGLFEPLSRQASQNAMGPWYIRDEQSPFRPGCSYQTLKMLVQRSRVTRETVLRGPSTRQFWMRACNVPGVAHVLGECHACHKDARADDRACGHCGASFGVEDDRQFLGLAEVRPLPGQAPAAAIARQIRSGGVVRTAGGSGGGQAAAIGVQEPDQRVQVEDLSSQGRVEFEREEDVVRDIATQYGPRSAKRNQSVVLGLAVAGILAAVVVFGVVIVMLVQGLQAPAPGPGPTAPAAGSAGAKPAPSR